MRVVFVSSGLSFHHGGSAFSEGALIGALQKKIAVTVLTPLGRVGKDLVAEYGIENIREFTKKDVFLASFDRGHWLRKVFENTDVCHLNGHWKWWYFLFAKLCERVRVPYIVHPRGMLLVGYRRTRTKKIFNFFLGNAIIQNSAKVISLSRFEVCQFAPYHLKSDQVMVIPNGIPVPDIKRGEFIPAPEIPNNVRDYFLYMGRLEARKNLVFLVDAYKEYCNSGGKSSLLIIGPPERGYDEFLRKHINYLKLTNSVFILEPRYQTGKTALLFHAKAVIYPTIDEPFGRVPFETIACMTYPIVPDQSGSAEYIRSLLPQCIYRNQDLGSLTTVLLTLDRVENKESDEQLQKAREWVKSELDWTKISNRVVELYQEVAVSQRNPKQFASTTSVIRGPLS